MANGIRNVVAFLEGEVLLCKAGLHPDQLDNITEQLDRARKEQWRQFEETGRALESLESWVPEPNPETCLVPRGPDEWMDSHGNWHMQRCDIRPDF